MLPGGILGSAVVIYELLELLQMLPIILSKVAICGNLWEKSFANFGELYGLLELEKKNLVMHKDCQKWQNLLGKVANVGSFKQAQKSPTLATSGLAGSCQK